ncbi:peptidylprolyl isomerase fpr3 [Marasmius crinis-equi]|uniref:FK506-binding protein n=1 Tax=Marasmius crinis-equi TaxID=585013 RepID=A0ABR3FTV7_9AGAR
MSVALALWSHAIVPGKPESFILSADLRITNASLGDVLQDENGRSTLKLTFEKLNTSDSDDEEEEEKEKEDDESKGVSTSPVCSLTPGKIEQAVLDIVLFEETEYILEVVGNNTIHLIGNYIHQNDNEPPYGDMGMSDMDSDDEGAYDLRDVSSDVEMHPDDLDGMDSDASRFEEVAEAEGNAAKSKKRARESDAAETKPASKAEKKNKKQKLEGAQQDKSASPEKGDKNEAEKKGKKEKKDQAGKQEAAERELSGGLKVKDAKVGTGPGAKNGQKIEMRYIGKLANGKQFDANTKGKPFKFALGAGEVIKGWDQGLVGIKVGGERVLTIPPAMGYGKRGSPPEIPPNSTLVFEVKCLSIK